VESLRGQGIVREAHKISILDDGNPSEATITTIHEVAGQLYDRLRGALCLDATIWMADETSENHLAPILTATETADNRLGVLVAAAVSVSAGPYSCTYKHRAHW
jgi:hypothetical protein